MRRSPARLALTASVAALVLAGCTGGSTTPSDDETGPLRVFFEKLGSSYQGDNAERQQREYEEAIAACMAEEGFEYVPHVGSSAGTEENSDVPEWDTREFAEQYGYGATTGDEIYASPEMDEEWVDPNAEYIESMSESEQAAFNKAMWGRMAEVDFNPDPEEEITWEEQGCSGRAQHEVYDTANDIWNDPDLKPMFDELGAESEKINDDPAVANALKEWRTCMADAGYDFATPQEASQSIHDELTALWESVAPPEGEVDPEAEADAYGPDPAAMDALKKKELELAPADFACKESSGYLKAHNTANLAMEKRLWEKYGEQLEAATADQIAGE